MTPEQKGILCFTLLVCVTYVLTILLLDWAERRARRNIRRIIKEHAEELANAPDEEKP